MGDRRLSTLRPDAHTLLWGHGCGAKHRLEGPLRAEAALRVHAIGLAAEHALAALGIPVVGHTGHLVELADLR